MSSQDSWSCLSVQKFFSLYNWQGQLLENRNWQHQDQPLNFTLWQCLSVQEFFNLGNWQGQPLENRNWQHQDQSLNFTLQSEAMLASRPDSWQCLSVQEFFNLGNWQGQPLENRNWHQAEDPSSCLKEQVREFFQFIPWEGTPEIGSLPKVSSFPEPTPSTPVKTTLTDLSELF